MSRRRRPILLPLAVLAALVVVVVVLFDWNWLKGPVEDRVSAALGREFEIAGDLDVDLSMTPTITLEQVRVANTEWGSRPEMARIEQVTFAIDLWQLLDGAVELPFLRVRAPDVLLETNREGEVNWRFGDEEPGEDPPPIPVIREVAVTDAAIRFHEPGTPDDVVANLETVAGTITEGETGVELRAEGSLDQRPLALTLTGGPIDRLRAGDEPYPFALDGDLGPTRVTVAGSAVQPFEAGELSAEVALESEDLGPLLALAGIEPPGLPALEVSALLTREGQRWALAEIDAQLGESDLSGSITLDRAGDEPAITADLRSAQVRIADLRPLVDALAGGAGDAAAEDPAETALAEAEAALAGADQDAAADLRAMLPPIDAEISYSVASLSGPEIALNNLELHGRLEDRLPRLSLTGDGQYRDEPVRIDVQLGTPLDQDADPGSYPIAASLAAAGTEAELEGAFTRPEQLAGLQLRFDVASRNLDALLALAGISAPEIPAFALDGELNQDGQSWQVSNLDGRLGESDIQGQATVTLGRPEPLISADLRSQQIRLADLTPLFAGPLEGVSGDDPEAAIDAAIARARAALEGGAQETEFGPSFNLRRDLLPGIDAEVSYRVASLSGPELALSDLDLHARLVDGLPRIALTGSGQYQEMPVEIDVQAGRSDQAAPAGGAYPIEAQITAAGTELLVDGQIGQPATLDGLDLEVRLSSQNINDVLALADLDLPQIPPFLITGHVIQDGQVWRVADLYGQFSESEIGGQLTADLSGQRPFITADLRSNRLLISDLVTATDKAGAIEEQLGDEGDAEPENEGGAIISAQGVNFAALPEIDADVSFESDYLEVAEFTFDQLQFELKLRDRIAVLDAAGDGKFRDGPISFEAHAGTEQSLQDPDAPYPVELRLESQRTLVTVDGSVAEPGQAAGLQADVSLEGPNLDRLGEILQLSLPTTPPFRLQSHLTHEAERWHLTELDGTIGDSDIQGQATIVLGGERPTLEAELSSNRLDFDDIGVLVGAPPQAGAEETASVEQERQAAAARARDTVLPTATFDVPQMRALDARVDYTAQSVEAAKLPLEGVRLELKLEDGILTLQPLRFDLAEGELETTARLNGRTDLIDGQIDLTVRQIRLNRLLSRFDIDIADIEVEQEGVGTFGGRANLEVQGNSIHDMAASADGEVLVIMDGGRISSLILEAIGLDIGEAIALLLSGEDEEQESEMVPVQCFVARFDVQDGVMQTEAMVLETSDATITGQGQIDLGEETLALELLAHPKDASVLTASTPVRIEGTFKDPEVDLISEELQEKGLAALALGVVLPVVGAVLPFIEGGETEDTNCGRLIAANQAAVPGADAAQDSE